MKSTVDVPPDLVAVVEKLVPDTVVCAKVKSRAPPLSDMVPFTVPPPVKSTVMDSVPSKIVVAVAEVVVAPVVLPTSFADPS